MTRVVLGCLVALVLAACGGTPAATTAPVGTTGPGGPATNPPAQASHSAAQSTPAGPVSTPPPAGGAGNNESIVKALVPPGATEISHVSTGGQYAVVVSSQMSLSDLEAFWDQKLPTTGVTVTGKLPQADSVVYAFTNPDGGITAADDGTGTVQIAISAGTS